MLLVSDIHFDPLHDPGKEMQLVHAPVAQWTAILSRADGPRQAAEFEQLQKKCHARGVDTSYALLRSSVAAMRKQLPDPKAIVVTGDLLAHGFPCRVAGAWVGNGPRDYTAFAARTMEFVMDQLRVAFPGVPMYVALGNNDTGCGDYQMDPGGRFLQETAPALAEGIPEKERAAALAEYSAGGYYSVRMAAPMEKTRMIVLNDLLLSPKYRSCTGAANAAPGQAEMIWLQRQLASARAHAEYVWVMGHIPPGVNAFATVTKFRNICADEKPDMFLDSGALDDLLMRYADVVRLGIFGHTHMDEMRLLGAGTGHAVAIKLVASISPVDGNRPSFTVARVNPAAARIEDFAVMVASNTTGVGATWSEEYDYRRSYGQREYSAAALAELMREFESDPKAQTALSQEYIRHYFKGSLAGELTPFWLQYACSLRHMTADGYARCACAAAR